MSAPVLASTAPGLIAVCILPRRLSPEQAESFLRFTPRIALRTRDPVCVFLDLRNTPLLREGSETLELRPRFRNKIHALLIRLEVLSENSSPPAIGWGELPSQALLRALGFPADPPLTPETLIHLLDPFGLEPTDAASGRTQTHKHIQGLHLSLESLGIRTYREFSRLPLQALGTRFGKSGVEAAKKIEAARTGALPELWPRFTPPEKLGEETQFEPDQEIPSSLEPLLFVLRPLIDRLCLRLRARSQRAAALKLTLEIRNRAHESVLTLSHPQGSTAGILPLITEHLRQNPIGNALDSSGPTSISRVGLEVSDTLPGLSAQRDFLDPLEQISEDWDALIGRLQQRLGSSAAFFVTPTRQHLPEQGWKTEPPLHPPVGSRAPHHTHPTRDTCPGRGTRPTRLLKRTVPLKIEFKAPSTWTLQWPTRPSRPDTRARTLHVHDPASQVEGPERLTPPVLSTATPRDRLYYRIHCTEGLLLWAYSLTDAPFESLTEVHLQGYFD